MKRINVYKDSGELWFWGETDAPELWIEQQKQFYEITEDNRVEILDITGQKEYNEYYTKREKILIDSDWTQLKDAPITPETMKEL